MKKQRMNKVIFLDRDGTINVDHGYVRQIADWQMITNVPEALKLLQSAGYKLAIITNQSAIADGRYTEVDMQNLHEHMKKHLIKYEVAIDAIAFCPHAREATCACRKPKTGMTRQVEEALGRVDYIHSWTVGDKEADVGFGKNVGTKTALIKSAYWNESALQQKPDLTVDSLYDFAVRILK